MTSEQCLEGLVDESGIGDSRTKAPSTGQETGVDGRAEPCPTHATSMPWPARMGQGHDHETTRLVPVAERRLVSDGGRAEEGLEIAHQSQ